MKFAFIDAFLLIVLIYTDVNGLTTQWFSLNGDSIVQRVYSEYWYPSMSSNCTQTQCYIMSTGTSQTSGLQINTTLPNITVSPLVYLLPFPGMDLIQIADAVFLPSGASVMTVRPLSGVFAVAQSSYTVLPITLPQMSYSQCFPNKTFWTTSALASYTYGPISFVWLDLYDRFFIYDANRFQCSFDNPPDPFSRTPGLRIIGNYNATSSSFDSFLLYAFENKLKARIVGSLTLQSFVLWTFPDIITSIISYKLRGDTIIYVCVSDYGLYEFNFSARSNPILLLPAFSFGNIQPLTPIKMILGSDTNNDDILILVQQLGGIFAYNLKTRQLMTILQPFGIPPDYDQLPQVYFNWELRENGSVIPCLVAIGVFSRTVSIFYFDRLLWENVGSNAVWKYGMGIDGARALSLLFQPVGTLINLFVITNLLEILQLKSPNGFKFNFMLPTASVVNETYSITCGPQTPQKILNLTKLVDNQTPSLNRVRTEIANKNPLIANLTSTVANVSSLVFGIVEIMYSAEKGREDISLIRYYDMTSYFRTGLLADNELKLTSYDQLFMYKKENVIYTWTSTNYTRK